MNEVQTQESNEQGHFRSRVILGKAVTPKMVVYFLKYGLAKTERAAGKILVAITIICFSLAVYFAIKAHYMNPPIQVESVSSAQPLP